MWFERVLYADYDYIWNVLIISIYMWLIQEKAVFAQLSSLNNLYNARVEVNETAVYCRSFLGLQSPTLNVLDLMQYNRKCCKHIITSCGLYG